jgi:hypothetical protein
MKNEEALKAGMEKYGPRKNDIQQSCVSCNCTKDMHAAGGKCKYCDLCEGFKQR